VPEARLLWLPLILAGALLYLWLAAALVRARTGPGSRTMGLALCAVAVWLATTVAEMIVPGERAYLAAVGVKYTAVALTPPAFLLFIAYYTERYAVRPRHVALLFLVPAATVGVVWSNPWHEWMWAHPPLGPEGERLARLDWGPWFRFVHVPVSYAIAVAGMLVALVELFAQSKLYRAQTAMLIVAVLVPFVANVLFTAGFGSSRIGPTPIAFAVSGTLLAFGFVRLRFFQLSPIAYRSVFDHMRDGVVVVDRYRRIVDVNQGALSLCGRGYRVEEALPWREAILPALEGAAAGPRACRAVDGRALELDTTSIRTSGERSIGDVVVLRDVTERDRAEAALRESEARLRRLIEHSPSGILHLRPVLGPAGDVRDFTCVLANPAAVAILGDAPRELVGRPFKDAVHPHTPALFQAFRDAVRTGLTCDVERRITRGGRDAWFRFIGSPVGAELLVTFFDVTERKEQEREMRAAASQDPLTGLLNRRGLEADAPAVLRACEDGDAGCSLLYLDLDDLKGVNDAFGHEAGDRVLAEFAARVHACTRGPDLLARVGGDEFVLLLPETELRGAEDVACRIVDALRRPFRVGSAAVTCGVSIGIAEQPPHGSELKDLLHAADRAMYAAKVRGGGIEAAPDPASGAAEPAPASGPDGGRS
jgi:diguanylate cyclase (GGDEF)-like protein/PAS domain S-box-containing protein